MALLHDDLGDDLGRDRLDIGPVRHVGIGHDGGGIGVDEDDPVALRAQRLAGLRPGIIELARLADDDRPAPMMRMVEISVRFGMGFLGSPPLGWRGRKQRPFAA